ncbi:DHHC zinc finger membrane protein, partial [Metarhizium majus ARSEF 297]
MLEDDFDHQNHQHQHKKLRIFSSPLVRRTSRLSQRGPAHGGSWRRIEDGHDESNSEHHRHDQDYDLPQFQRYEEPTLLEIFYDLFFAANYNVFNDTQQVTGQTKFKASVGYFWFVLGGRFLLTNITNIDMLRRRQTFNLAVRIPLGTPASTKYQTITYPILPKVAGATGSGQLDDDAAASTSARDQDAFRTFAILKTEPYENPWDLGFWENWKSVMGNEPWEWFLPIRHSPCCNHDSMHSDYRLGPVLDDLKKRYELPKFPDGSVSPTT